jgi:hypothetical protein
VGNGSRTNTEIQHLVFDKQNPLGYPLSKIAFKLKEKSKT